MAWAERGSCSAWSLLLLFFFCRWADPISLGQISNDATYDAYSFKAVKTLMYWKLFYEHSTLLNEYSKYVIHGMCQHLNFSWAACWIRLCLFWTFISPGTTVIDVTVNKVFFLVLHKKSDLSFCFYEASSEIGRKIKHLQAKQRTCQNV